MLPSRYNVLNKEISATNPFFIFGSGRNGSTLLNVILNQHPDIFLPPEQYFLGKSIVKYQMYNYLIWRDLVKIIYAELIPETDNHLWQFDPEQIIHRAFHFKIQERTLQKLVNEIYFEYSRQANLNGIIWGDTTPHNSVFINEIYDCFPKAKYIFLLRDGRDVAAAFKKGGKEIFDELAQPINSIGQWIDAIKQYDYLKSKTNVHLVTYEDLVMDTDKTLLAISDFLEIEFQIEFQNFHKNVPIVDQYKKAFHENLYKPINASSIGQWVNILDATEKELVMSKASPLLRRFNYI